ncbi:aldehyde ferredoxin oxidoreductase N-terminal domain-containing protein [Desulfurococcus mucosus]|uniref:Glyceraldehyde-3-phosphate ferredoxin oxidoreductase n=1 Tax=Desulfurococcus mucosus (strain ATCC 35584 / DSM 2162 / JCM 9187 / O7/1) TaxID=765177 RepID=E8R8U8_DESM0|nr:aldehyde ferredoxin oxidoreductase N-terminal domain-containing protein [Desulfurococcus mucosus]ADV64924.1 glyceraldehyde-3-phosphate ferredoxin oxidoreductase [Desulfurococcus mucosus DSM 2162]
MEKRRYRALFIDASSRRHWVEEYDLSEIYSPISLGLKLHMEIYKSWSKPVYHPDNVLVLGAGLFAGSKMYGTHRFIAVFRSPLTRGLHVSEMGGAAFQFRVNADALVVLGRSEVPLIVKVYDKGDGEPVVEFHEIPDDTLEGVWRGYKGYRGIYALQQYLSDSFTGFYEEFNGRSILVGPASKYTNIGALASITLSKGRMDLGSEDFAARAGGGSVLYRAHGVAAIIYGGRYDRSVKVPVELNDVRELDKLFMEITRQPYTQSVINAGVKYRYDPKLNTGGTLGGNYPHLKVTTPVFNWNMIYLPKAVRERLHELIMKHIWEPFNKEAIESRSWKTCGEPCPLACKKVRLGKYKSDYEPYNGLGPFIGVMDIHDAEKVVELADAYGFDAIELGQIVGFIFEALYKGLLKPEEVGLPGKPFFDPAAYTMEHSRVNAELATRIVEQLAFGTNPVLRLIGEKGLRAAAKVLDILYRERVVEKKTWFSDIPVYAAFGEEGHITPNFYWTPGLIAPLAVLGKYWTVYSGVFMEPEDFASKSVERAIYEALISDAGLCRFHRGWAEKAVPILLEKFYGVEKPLEKTRELYKRIAEYQKLAGALPVFWESGKTVDFMALAAEEYGSPEWVAKFKADKKAAAREWWERFYRRVEELVGLGAR